MSELSRIRARAKPLLEMSEPLAVKMRQSHTVAPNRRIARAIEESYGDWQLAQGQRAWARPDVATFSAYLLREGERLLARASPNMQILSPATQRALFLSVAPAQITDPENWYPEIAQAWTLVHHFGLESDEAAHLETSNTLAFRQWAEAAQALLDKQALITEAQLCKKLTAALDSHHWRPEKPLIAAAFGDAHRATPVEAKLKGKLTRMGLLTRFKTPQTPKTNSTPRLVEFEQPEDELRAIALWARQCLEQATAPIAIGIAFPDVGTQRLEIERQLTNLLYPYNAPAADDARLFDIAGGTPLDALGVCHHALLFLRGALVGISTQDRERLIDSPFLDARKTPQSLGGRGRRKRPLSAWLATFQKALQAVSWPAGAQLDSLTFQHASALAALASELARASGFSPDCNAETALLTLERAARERRHEVQRTGAPIRVLGIEDASELRFTHLWVAGMRSADWPAPTTANAFVPRQSQRSCGVPGVTPESRLGLARSITENLLRSAETLVFSYAQFDGDERQGLSALLPETIATTPDYFVARQHRALVAYSHPFAAQDPATLVAIDDQRAPACTPAERGATAALVRDQSNCPLRAFAVHRLGIAEPAIASSLPDARMLGNAVHGALELAYRNLPDQTTLRSHPDLAGLSEQSAKNAVETVMPALPRSLVKGHINLIAQVVNAWFRQDSKRPDYANLRTELEVSVNLEGMALRLKIDRLDQDIDTGQWVITDYKMSPPPLTRLRSGASLHEPQLALYAEALREAQGIEPVSLAFGAAGSAEEAGYRHCSHDPRFVRRASERAIHAQVLNESGAMVRSLLRDFCAGEAGVTPRPLACERCHLDALCRIGQEARA